MATEYKIPLKFKSGKYNITELLADSENVLILSLGEFGVLSYSVPEYETEVRLYDITEQIIENTLFATYDDCRVLKYLEFIKDDEKRLVYINFTDNEVAKEKIIDFAEQSADIISNELIKCKDKVARLFIEYFCDGESVDFAAKIGTAADKQAAIDSLSERAKQRGLEKSVIDNSGNYPHKNRVECDNHTFGIMLLCAMPCQYSELFDLAVDIMTKLIKNSVIDTLDKSDDFKFIVSEYD